MVKILCILLKYYTKILIFNMEQNGDFSFLHPIYKH